MSKGGGGFLWRRGRSGFGGADILWASGGGRAGVRSMTGCGIMACLSGMEAVSFSDAFGTFSGGKFR